LGRDPEQGQHRLEETEPALGGLDVRGQAFGLQLREEVGQLAPDRSQPLPHSLQVGGDQVIADRFQERQIGECQLGLRTAADHHRHPLLRRPLRQHARQPGLAHPGIAGQEHNLALAPVGAEECVLEPGQLLLPADQDRTEHPLHRAHIIERGSRVRRRS
jgi:hypothetical protein